MRAEGGLAWELGQKDRHDEKNVKPQILSLKRMCTPQKTSLEYVDYERILQMIAKSENYGAQQVLGGTRKGLESGFS